MAPAHNTQYKSGKVPGVVTKLYPKQSQFPVKSQVLRGFKTLHHFIPTFVNFFPS